MRRAADKRLKALEQIRITNNYTKAHIAKTLGAPLPQYYTNWLRRNGLPKKYYDAADSFIESHADGAMQLIKQKPAYGQPQASTTPDVDLHAAVALAERLPSALQLKLAQTLLNSLVENQALHNK